MAKPTPPRWIDAVVDEIASGTPQLPWERGAKQQRRLAAQPLSAQVAPMSHLGE